MRNEQSRLCNCQHCRPVTGAPSACSGTRTPRHTQYSFAQFYLRAWQICCCVVCVTANNLTVLKNSRGPLLRPLTEISLLLSSAKRAYILKSWYLFQLKQTNYWNKYCRGFRRIVTVQWKDVDICFTATELHETVILLISEGPCSPTEMSLVLVSAEPGSPTEIVLYWFQQKLTLLMKR